MVNQIMKKIATLCLFGLLLETTIRLLWHSQDFKSPSSIGGGIFLVFSVILGIILVLDYRYKEYVDNTIKQQNDVINSLSQSLQQKQETTNVAEKVAQRAIENYGKEEKGRGKSTYSVEKETETLTKSP